MSSTPSKTDAGIINSSSTINMSSGNTNNTSNNIIITNNNNNNNNNNNSNSNNSNGSSNHHTEQPQTKRQKIEKIKTNAKNIQKTSKTTTTTTTTTKVLPTPPPDIIDTGESKQQKNGESVIETNGSNGGVGGKHICSSLSSSAHSISTPSSSTNNSPTSTPSSSRATSLSQLINVQNFINIFPPIATSSIVHTHPVANIIHNAADSAASSSSSAEQSADEVDRIVSTTTLPDLLPTLAMLPICSSSSSGGSTKTRTMQPAAISADELSAAQDMREFEESLTKQCLCGVSERTLRKPFQSHYSLDANGHKRIANLSEWPTNKLLQFLSNLQLLFDIYLKQNSKGFICARIMDVCDALISNDHNLIDEIIVLAGYNNTYVQFLAGRVLASFLVIAKQEMDDDWLKKIVDNLFNFDRLDHVAVQRIHFSLEIIKRVVEWKDVDLHPLEDEITDIRNVNSTTNTSSSSSTMVATTASATAAAAAVTTSNNHLESTHAYLHFEQHQPTLETNYFAVHFQAEHRNENNAHANEVNDEHPEEEADDVDEDEDEDIVEVVAEERASRRNMLQREHEFNNDLSVLQMRTMTTPHNYMHNEEPQMSAYHQQAAASYAFSPNMHYEYAFAQQQQQQHSSSNGSNSVATAAAATSASLLTGCHIITLTDSESFDTAHLKCITIKILENKWPALVENMSTLIANHLDIDNAENCILNFLHLWENIISVKANLSIVETLPFYAQLDKFEMLLNQNLSCTIYKQMLCLFNEALCYGSTLALQDMLPKETCGLAHQIVRHVGYARMLDSLPRRQPENLVGLIGFKGRPIAFAAETLLLPPQRGRGGGGVVQHAEYPLGGEDVIEMNKTILQKMVLLVLKSIAVTVKEIRSDSSDSSIDSTDNDVYEDMVVIERSIRDVLRKLEYFIKHKLEFHPECHFSKILIHLFDDQDDHLIEAMVCTLDVTAGISFRKNAFPELVAMLNPVYTFLEFLKMISNSTDLLLDLLVSNETCFLLYLLRFLKYIRLNWEMFVQSCGDFVRGANTLDEAMSVLIRLRLQISRLVSRQLYPYDISPVLRLLESCESLYEGNELS